MEQMRGWKQVHVKGCVWMIPYSKYKPQYLSKRKFVPHIYLETNKKNGVGII